MQTTDMSVKITSDFILNLMSQAAAGNAVPLMEALDPHVRWRIGSDTKDEVTKTGIYVSISTIEGDRSRFYSIQVGGYGLSAYAPVCIFVTNAQYLQNRAGWMEQVFEPLQSKLKEGFKLIPLEVDVSHPTPRLSSPLPHLVYVADTLLL